MGPKGRGLGTHASPPRKGIWGSHQMRGCGMKGGPGELWTKPRCHYYPGDPDGPSRGTGADVGKCQPQLLGPRCHRPCVTQATLAPIAGPTNPIQKRISGQERWQGRIPAPAPWPWGNCQPWVGGAATSSRSYQAGRGAPNLQGTHWDVGPVPLARGRHLGMKKQSPSPSLHPAQACCWGTSTEAQLLWLQLPLW